MEPAGLTAERPADLSEPREGGGLDFAADSGLDFCAAERRGKKGKQKRAKTENKTGCLLLIIFGLGFCHGTCCGNKRPTQE